MIHSNERVPKERVAKITIEEPERSSRDYECTAESTKDKENSDFDIRNNTSQKSQGKKQTKGRARGSHQQNQSAKP